MTSLTNEADRLRALRELKLLDTPPSERFDRITRLAASFYGTPISAVSLTDADRQWFKSRVGTAGTQIPRDRSPCAEVTALSDVLIVPDLALDPRFVGTPLTAAGVRFYAGAPLVTREGHTLGAMCVLDTAPREMGPAEAQALTDMAAMVMDQIELQHALGRIDPASGLPNSHQFCEDLDDLGREHDGRPAPAACHVVLIDLDDAGNLATAVRVIGPQHVGGLVRRAVRAVREVLAEDVTLYQVGATRLAVMLADEGRRDTLVAALLEMIEAQAVGRTARTTLAVVAAEPGIDEPEDVLRRAYVAAQDAREARAPIGHYSAELDGAHRRRFHLVADLERTLGAEGQLSVVFQPRVDLGAGSCGSVEALLRWTHPELGPVSPGEFIPLAEVSGLARGVTRFVLDAALAQVAAWRAAGSALTVSVNVSAYDLEAPEFAVEARRALARHGLGVEALEVEFTESALIRDRERVLDTLMALRALGIRIAIDDFGTGYSSFSYLHDLPVDIVKIDQSFVRTLVPGDRQSRIVGAMIEMAHGLGLRVVAEGVETGDALAFLAEAGCDEVQGYHLCRPLAAADLPAWITSWRGAELAAA